MLGTTSFKLHRRLRSSHFQINHVPSVRLCCVDLYQRIRLLSWYSDNFKLHIICLLYPTPHLTTSYCTYNCKKSKSKKAKSCAFTRRKLVFILTSISKSLINQIRPNASSYSNNQKVFALKESISYSFPTRIQCECRNEG